MDDVIIVGAGWAGLSAAAFALKHGAKVRLIAQGIGTLVVTPGWISVLDGYTGETLDGIREIIARFSEHPYALAGDSALEEAIAAFKTITAEIGLPYDGDLRHNRRQPTALGIAQHPALVPPGHRATTESHDGDGTFYIGFSGWRDYYPSLSGAHSAYIELPLERPWDASPTDLARQFDSAEFRTVVATRIKSAVSSVSGARCIGLPAVIGLDQHNVAIRDLSAQVGLPIFELPTLPPSVPGSRLFGKLRRWFLDNRVRVQIGHPVFKGIVENGRAVGVEVAAAGKPQPFRAKSVILATGGLYGGGLFSDDRGRIWEPIFGLPVEYAADQTTWFSDELLDTHGHAVHYFGVRANKRLQPLGADGRPVAEGLFVAGHILAHPVGGPSPMVTAEGVALATAYKAVKEALS